MTARPPAHRRALRCPRSRPSPLSRPSPPHPHHPHQQQRLPGPSPSPALPSPSSPSTATSSARPGPTCRAPRPPPPPPPPWRQTAARRVRLRALARQTRPSRAAPAHPSSHEQQHGLAAWYSCCCCSARRRPLWSPDSSPAATLCQVTPRRRRRSASAPRPPARCVGKGEHEPCFPRLSHCSLFRRLQAPAAGPLLRPRRSDAQPQLKKGDKVRVLVRDDYPFHYPSHTRVALLPNPTLQVAAAARTAAEGSVAAEATMLPSTRSLRQKAQARVFGCGRGRGLFVRSGCP